MSENSAAPAGKTVKGSALLRVRVRCDGKHGAGEPWLAHLHVLWRAVDPEHPDGRFEEAVTDDKGYLVPASGDATKAKTWALGAQYECYFVRHPSLDVVTQSLGPPGPANTLWGAPLQVTVALAETGKGAKGGVKEAVISVPSDPKSYVPRGSQLYGGWVLYRNEHDGKCGTVRPHIHKLQRHLGAMRYLVGGSSNPYVPEVPAKNAEFPTDGCFEVMLWNSVMRFQQDFQAEESQPAVRVSSEAMAAVLKPELEEAELPVSTKEVAANGLRFACTRAVEPLDEPWAAGLSEEERRAMASLRAEREHAPTFDPPPAAAEKTASVLAALAEQTGVPITREELPRQIACDGVVDAKTAAAIACWLHEHRRKPGGILLPAVFGDRPADGVGAVYWMHQDALEPLRRWSAHLQLLGFRWGVRLNHSYRDARKDVSGAAYGRASLSIHKTGCAFDLRMSHFADATAEFPVYYQRENMLPRTSWRIFAKVTRPSAVAPEDEPFFVKRIQPWQYDDSHPDGGWTLPSPARADDELFLDITAVAAVHGFFPISSFAAGWFAVDAEELSLDGHDAFERYVAKLNGYIEQVSGRQAELDALLAQRAKSKAPDRALDRKIAAAEGRVFFLEDGNDMDALREDAKLLSEWLALTKPFGPSPEITIDLTRKAGCELFNQLGKKWNGREVYFASLRGTSSSAAPKAERLTLFGGWSPPWNLFQIGPVARKMAHRRGDVASFPSFAGKAIGMEWWHFQYDRGIEGKLWSEILEDMGWTKAGLAGKELPGPYQELGLGYSQKKLAEAAAASAASKAAKKDPAAKSENKGAGAKARSA